MSLPGVLAGCGWQAYVAAVAGEGYPLQWTGRQAVVPATEHLDVSNAGQLSEQLLVLPQPVHLIRGCNGSRCDRRGRLRA